jgi:hypothetical protein
MRRSATDRAIDVPKGTRQRAGVLGPMNDKPKAQRLCRLARHVPMHGALRVACSARARAMLACCIEALAEQDARPTWRNSQKRPSSSAGSKRVYLNKSSLTMPRGIPFRLGYHAMRDIAPRLSEVSRPPRASLCRRREAVIPCVTVRQCGRRHPFAVQCTQSRCRCGNGGRSPGADVAAVDRERTIYGTARLRQRTYGFRTPRARPSPAKRQRHASAHAPSSIDERRPLDDGEQQQQQQQQQQQPSTTTFHEPPTSAVKAAALRNRTRLRAHAACDM